MTTTTKALCRIAGPPSARMRTKGLRARGRNLWSDQARTRARNAPMMAKRQAKRVSTFSSDLWPVLIFPQLSSLVSPELKPVSPSSPATSKRTAEPHTGIAFLKQRTYNLRQPQTYVYGGCHPETSEEGAATGSDNDTISFVIALASL